MAWDDTTPPVFPSLPPTNPNHSGRANPRGSAGSECVARRGRSPSSWTAACDWTPYRTERRRGEGCRDDVEMFPVLEARSERGGNQPHAGRAKVWWSPAFSPWGHGRGPQQGQEMNNPRATPRAGQDRHVGCGPWRVWRAWGAPPQASSAAVAVARAPHLLVRAVLYPRPACLALSYGGDAGPGGLFACSSRLSACGSHRIPANLTPNHLQPAPECLGRLVAGLLDHHLVLGASWQGRSTRDGGPTAVIRSMLRS